MNSAVIIFTKVPIPGLVKTRLTHNTCLTQLDSAKIAEAMLKDTITLASKTNTDSIHLGYYPDEHIAKLHEIVNYVRREGKLTKPLDFVLQNGSNFDQRFGSVVQEAFRKDFEILVIIGADLPFLSPEIINMALESLTKHKDERSLFIGPSIGGGIYLIGFTNNFNPSWFSDYQLLSSGLELSKVANFCKENNFLLNSLPPYGDVDIEEDLVTLISYINLLKNSEKYVGFHYPYFTAKIIEQLRLTIVEEKNQTRQRKISKKDDSSLL